MPKQTNRTRLTAALLARGYVPDPRARTTKYKTFAPTPGARILLKPSQDDLTHRVFVGKAGSLRFSPAGTVTTSIPFSEGFRQRLLAEGTSP